MHSNSIEVYGADWCGDCRRAKKFFQDYDIAYNWHDTDTDKDAAEVVRQANHGKRIIPTIFFPDGTILVEPTNQQLAKQLGIIIDPAYS